MLLFSFVLVAQEDSTAIVNDGKASILLEVVEFDPDIEDIYERFGTGLDADN